MQAVQVAEPMAGLQNVFETHTTSSLYPVRLIVREVFQNKINPLEILAEHIVKSYNKNLKMGEVISST